METAATQSNPETVAIVSTLNPAQEEVLVVVNPDTPDAAVNTSTSTTDPAQATADIIDAATTNLSDNTYMSAASAPSATEGTLAAFSAPTSVNLLDAAPGDPPYMVKFKTTILAALVNPNFTGDIKKVEKGRVESRFHPALPHQTVRAVFPHTAFRCSSLQNMRFLPTRCCRHFVQVVPLIQ